LDARVGDVIEVHSVQVGGQQRRGKVLEVISTSPLELRVRWEDGHESVFYPSAGMVRLVERSEA
jgi:hypothetical protein